MDVAKFAVPTRLLLVSSMLSDRTTDGLLVRDLGALTSHLDVVTVTKSIQGNQDLHLALAQSRNSPVA